MSTRRAFVAACGVVAVSTFAGLACREPTQITVAITSNASCPSGALPTLSGVAIIQGDTILETTQCTQTASGADVGTIAIVPGSRGTSGTVKLKVMGLLKTGSGAPATKVAECTSVNKECIVATRTLSFVEHTSLPLPIVLEAQCAGFPCPDGATCEVVGGAPKCKSDCRGSGCNQVDASVADADVADAADASDGSVPVAVSLVADDLFSGHGSTCAHLTAGGFVCWGANGKGQLFGPKNPRPPEVVPQLADSSSIAFGARHGCRTSFKGTVDCWGANDVGQLGPGTDVNGLTNVPFPPKSIFESIAAGIGFTCVAVSSIPKPLGVDPSVYCWGDDTAGQSSGSGLAGSVAPPTFIPQGNGRTLALGDDFACSAFGSAQSCSSCKVATCWGQNAKSQAGSGNGGLSPAKAITSPIFRDAIHIAAGPAYTLLSFSLTADNVMGWGDNGKGLVSATAPKTPITPGLSDRPRGPYVLGADFGCALVGGVVQCWGGGSVVKGAHDFGKIQVLKIAGGEDYACALLSNGAVHCWGEGGRGQLGGASGPDAIEIEYTP